MLQYTIMSRVYERPKALLDGATEATRIVLPGSDAERYFDEGRVFEKVPSLMGYLALLSNPEMPRLVGITRTIKVAGHRMTAIQGEDVAPDEPEAMYAFALGPDSGEFVEVSRVVGDKSTVLTWADVQDQASPIFRTPDLTGVIDEPAKIAELTQILAAGQDATEWALD
jgi:hypothetical protein